MRLIGSLNNQAEAQSFSRFCKTKKIDIFLDIPSKPSAAGIQIWVVAEEDTDQALEFLEAFKKDPASPEFFNLEEPEEKISDDYGVQEKVPLKKARLTWIWILASVLIFFIQVTQELSLVEKRGSIMMEVALTPIEQAFFYDVPQGFSKLEDFVIEKNIRTKKDLNQLPEKDLETWKDLQTQSYFHGFLDMLDDKDYKNAYLRSDYPLAQKILKGQIYRLITPVFLHGSILHILFNMLWIFMLMKQVEIKIGVLKTLGLCFIAAAFSNTCQYFVSGPFFVGASGIIVALATFIWVRQKKAPWEGYIFSKPAFIFLAGYVLALVILSIAVFVFNLSSEKNLSFGIANTAHVSGGIAGLIMGLMPIFRRR